MDARVAISVAMWFVAWSTMLGGFGIAFSLPRDHREDVRNEVHDVAFEKWRSQHPEKELPVDEKSDHTKDEAESFKFSISADSLTKAVLKSAEYDQVQALVRVAMIVGIAGAAFFVVLVITAGIKELKQTELDSNQASSDESSDGGPTA
jgi:hypothetical protein